MNLERMMDRGVLEANRANREKAIRDGVARTNKQLSEIQATLHTIEELLRTLVAAQAERGEP